MQEMNIVVKAERMQSANVYSVVQTTIKEIFPRYYTDEVVQFFLELHSLEAISEYIIRKTHNKADVVIAKGQANYESLSEEKKNTNFMFMTKYKVIAND